MVGWLVEQKQIGLTGERTANGGAAFFPATRGFGFAVEVDAELVGNRTHRIFGRPLFAVYGKVHQPVERSNIGILVEHHDVGTRDDNALALVCLYCSGDKFHQRSLARAIAANQCQPITCADKQIDILEQPPAALLERKLFEGEDGRLGHIAGRIRGRTLQSNLCHIVTLNLFQRRFFRIDGCMKAKWTLNQVQGDGFGELAQVRTIYLNGKYIPETEGHVSVFDRGFLFSDSVYEVVSVLDGRLVDFDGHVRRLARSLNELRIIGAPEAEAWLTICRELVTRNAVEEGMIYWQVTRGAPVDRDFVFPSADTAPTILAFTQSRALANNPVAKRGISVVTLPDLRWGRADIKTTQLLYASLMKNEAIARGADDAWMERGGVVTEGTAQNAHIITKDGVLVTHPLNREILHGITRAAVLPMVAQTIEERPFSVAEAEQAAEAFVSSASSFVMPVVRINGKLIGDGTPGSATIQLRKAYIDWARRTAI